MLVVGAIIVAAAVVWGALAIARELRSRRDDVARERQSRLMALFAPGIAAAMSDPRALLAWQPLAAGARSLFPDDFAALDRAAGSTFPFSVDQLQAAHARWTAEWLAWERAHDAEFKLKGAAAERDLAATGGAAVERARVDAVEREKLELYQRRYEEYIRVAKALQALGEAAKPRA